MSDGRVYCSLYLMTFVSDSFILVPSVNGHDGHAIHYPANIPLACAHLKHNTTLFFLIGSVMCLNASVLPVFDQLGLTKEILAASKPIREFNFFRGSMKRLGQYSDHSAIERYILLSIITFFLYTFPLDIGSTS